MMRLGSLRLRASVTGAMLLASLTPATAQASEPSMRQLVDRLVECRSIEGENYCLYLGFTQMAPGGDRWQEMVNEGDAYGETNPPGAMSLKQSLEAALAQPPRERAEHETAMWESATRAVGKVKVSRHIAEQTPLPEGFFDDHPHMNIAEGSPRAEELRDAAATGDPIDTSRWHQPTEQELAEEARVTAMTGTTDGIDVQASTHPSSRYLIYDAYRQQIDPIYCGPATMQSIDGGDDGGFNSQNYWADVLGTTSDGTSIQDLVSTINGHTGWDDKAGDYAVIDSDGWGATFYFSHHKVNIGSYGTVMVDHVKLRDEYFPYLASDHNGHFQTARGYSEGNGTIAIFEPYDERDWSSGGNYTGTRQYVDYVNAYQANQAYPAWNTNVGS